MRTGSSSKLLTLLLCLLCAVALSTALVVTAHAEPGLHSDLTTISGQGSGHVEVSPTGKDKPFFAVEVQVNVKDMLPDSTFTVQRTLDFTPDGVCTGTTWLTNGPITTSDNGAGAQHFEVERGAPFVSGVRFDVEFRVIGNGAELRSDCMTVTVK